VISGEFGVFVARGHVRGNAGWGGGTQMFGTDDRIAHSPNKPHSVHFEGGKATNTNRPKKCSPVAGGLPIMDGPESWRPNPQKELFGPLDRRGPTTIRDPDDPDRVATVPSGAAGICMWRGGPVLAKRCPCQTNSDRGLTNHAVGF
jgi:hypothetical protein